MKTKLTKAELTEKVGKKSFFADECMLAAKLNYDSGIPEFDTYLDGKSLKKINAVIHLIKYPKGLVIKIAKNFSSFPFGIPYSEIKRTMLSENIEKPNLIIETVDKGKIIFSLKTESIAEVKQFIDTIHLNDDEKNKSETINKEAKLVNNTKHGVPALFSFFIPGLGQLIKGHFSKAIVIWVVGGIVGFFLWWTYVIPFIVWVWNVYDAYNSNENWGSNSSNEKK